MVSFESVDLESGTISRWTPFRNEKGQRGSVKVRAQRGREARGRRLLSEIPSPEYSKDGAFLPFLQWIAPGGPQNTRGRRWGTPKPPIPSYKFRITVRVKIITGSLLLLRTYFPKIPVTVTILKFG